jgi:hypothetical protein
MRNMIEREKKQLEEVHTLVDFFAPILLEVFYH